MGNYKTIRYTAVVETGSSSIDQTRHEQLDTCGHAHKTRDAAVNCLSKKQRYYCQHGRSAGSACSQCLGFARAEHTSAHWYNGAIHDQDGRRV